jgi:hypothetical protein
LFYLLVGRHPFENRRRSNGDVVLAIEGIRERSFCYVAGVNESFEPPVSTAQEAFDQLDDVLKMAFLRTFSEGLIDSRYRYSATQWKDVLAEAWSRLRERNPVNPDPPRLSQKPLDPRFRTLHEISSYVAPATPAQPGLTTHARAPSDPPRGVTYPSGSMQPAVGAASAPQLGAVGSASPSVRARSGASWSQASGAAFGALSGQLVRVLGLVRRFIFPTVSIGLVGAALLCLWLSSPWWFDVLLETGAVLVAVASSRHSRPSALASAGAGVLAAVAIFASSAPDGPASQPSPVAPAFQVSKPLTAAPAVLPTAPAALASSVCGQGDAPSGVLPEVWSTHTCRARTEVGFGWANCLRWPRYASARELGCPDEQRCCPSASFAGAVNLPFELCVEDTRPPAAVRAGPAAETPVVAELANGTPVVAEQTRDEWTLISGAARGWVWTSWLRPCAVEAGALGPSSGTEGELHVEASVVEAPLGAPSAASTSPFEDPLRPVWDAIRREDVPGATQALRRVEPLHPVGIENARSLVGRLGADRVSRALAAGDCLGARGLYQQLRTVRAESPAGSAFTVACPAPR